MDILELIGRKHQLFVDDVSLWSDHLEKTVSPNRFLVIGGAGSIGQAVTKELFKRKPKTLHVVDVSENNLVELVRDIRSTLGHISGDFRTFAIDCGGREFEALMVAEGAYDYVLNLSALKHVRSEKDPFTLMRMIEVNVLNTLKTLKLTSSEGEPKYFCVSTDKAANPVNMMGASKRIMEMFLMRESETVSISAARFANVAFSDGSLLHGFNQRLAKRQPISAPDDVLRYFVTSQESGELCILSCLLGENRDVFFPKLTKNLHLISFAQIAVHYLESLGFEPYECDSENEARDRAPTLIAQKKWPCYFFASDTTGEKGFEEFYTGKEVLDMDRFDSIGVIKNEPKFEDELLNSFIRRIGEMRSQSTWTKDEIVTLFHEMIPDFAHKETGKYLDQKM